MYVHYNLKTLEHQNKIITNSLIWLKTLCTNKYLFLSVSKVLGGTTQQIRSISIPVPHIYTEKELNLYSTRSKMLNQEEPE